MPRLGRNFRRGTRRLGWGRPGSGGGGGGAGNTVHFPDDFTYLGAYRVPSNTTSGEAYNGRSLTGRVVAADTTEPRHLLSMSFAAANHGVFEFRVGTPTIPGSNPYAAASYPQTTIVKDYGQQPYTNGSGTVLINNADLDGNAGITWVEHESRLYWTWSAGYGTIGWMGYGTLNYAAGTGVGYGRYSLVSPREKAVSRGLVVFPQSFADAHLGGKRLGWGWGGYQSIIATGDVSLGPVLQATDAFPSDGFPTNRDGTGSMGGTGARTLTDAGAPFTSDMVTHYVYVWGGGGWSLGLYQIESYISATQIVLATSPTGGSPQSGGSYVIYKAVASQAVLGYWPTYESPAAGRGRCDRPEPFDVTDYSPVNQAWGGDKWSWTDRTSGAVVIDEADYAPTVLFGGVCGREEEQYIQSTVFPLRNAHWAASYALDDLPPVTGAARYEAQPEFNDIVEFPWLDYSQVTYAGPAYRTGEATLTSTAGRQQNSLTGCLLTMTGHGLVEQSGLHIRNADSSQYNGLWKVVGAVTGDQLGNAATTSGAGSTTLDLGVGANAQSSWVGAMIQIRATGGGSNTNFVLGRYEITAVNSATQVVLATSPTPAGAGSGGNWQVSGVVSSNQVYIYNTTYTSTWDGTTSNNAELQVGDLTIPGGQAGGPETFFGWHWFADERELHVMTRSKNTDILVGVYQLNAGGG